MSKILKAVLLFGLIVVSLDFLRQINFFREDLSMMFNFLFIIFSVALPFIYLISTAFITYFITARMTSSGLGFSLVKALIFAVIYPVIRLIITYLISLVSSLNFYFDTYRDFVNQIPINMIQGIVFLFVLNHVIPSNTSIK